MCVEWGNGKETHKQRGSPAVQSSVYLGMLLCAHDAGGCIQRRVPPQPTATATATATVPVGIWRLGESGFDGTVDDGAPDRHGLGQCVWDTFSRTRRVDYDEALSTCVCMCVCVCVCEREAGIH